MNHPTFKKVFTKNDWLKLIKKNMCECHHHEGDISREYYTTEDLIVKIETKTRRNYTFGCPAYCATLRTSNPVCLYLNYLIPPKEPVDIKWENIKSINFRFVSA